ncbi:MAG TPA: hypothetical protein VK427_19060 [Kofleriaceae bacterium]|nr:hypothetical protein [Kofleriaceae bacterium]
MTKHLLPAFAASIALLSTTAAVADDDLQDGETPQQRDDRLAAQAGHYAVGIRVQAASAVGDTFNFVGLELGGRYNVSDNIAVGARIPFAVSKPDNFAVFGGMMARADLRLGATVGVGAEAGFLKYGAVLLSQQDAPGFADGADYELAFTVGPWLRAKAGPTYLSINPAFVYQGGDPEGITGLQLPVTAMFRAAGLARFGAQLGIYTGDDFGMSAEDGGRIAVGLVADTKVSTVSLQVAAGFASLLTDDASAYRSIGTSVYFTVGLAYVK